MSVSSPSTAQRKPSAANSAMPRIGVSPPINGLQICGTSNALPMISSSSTLRGASMKMPSAPAAMKRSARRRASSRPWTARASVRPKIHVSGLRRSAQAARILASASSIGTTFLPAMWPQRLGHC